MKNLLLLVFAFTSVNIACAQKISATVKVNAKQTGQMQLSIFNTLESSIQGFVNNTKWSNDNLPNDQRINCSFFIIIKSYSNNNFKASIQVRSSRPVYGSSMTTPVFNFKDRDFDFTYTEHQPLEFDANTFKSNLVSTLGFYVYVILGLDADTFSPDGGDSYFEQANKIAQLAQQSGHRGWTASSGNNSRYELNRQLNSSNFRDYHQALYLYHRKGLDMMHEDVEKGKKNIASAIELLGQVNRNRPGSLLIRTFFDAKADEVAAIFSGGPSIDVNKVVKDLYNMAPTHSKLWSQIKS